MNNLVVKRKVLISLILCLIAIFFSSCFTGIKRTSFHDQLSLFDSYIASENINKAIKILPRLRKTARSSTQWLSVGKRYINLNDLEGAESALREALSIIPANDTLTALLTGVLLLQGNLEQASKEATLLLDSRFLALASYSILTGQKWKPLALQRVEPWIIAAEETGFGAFYVNAALALALAKNCAKASYVLETFELSKGSDRNNFEYVLTDLLSLLQFDGALYNKVRAGESSESIRLAGDAAWLDSRGQDAFILWKRASELSVTQDPALLFTLALVSEEEGSARSYLEQCLDIDPSFYPALARYVRSAENDDSSLLLDPLEQQLHAYGLVSRRMRGKLTRIPVSIDDARIRLNAAKKLPAEDFRIEAELIRFEFNIRPDAVRFFSSLWTLVEKFPDDQLARSWAGWSFVTQGDLDSGLSVLLSGEEDSDPFWKGVSKAINGDLEAAAIRFGECAGDLRIARAALANRARIRERQKRFPEAIEDYSLAAGMAVGNIEKSMLHYNSARVMGYVRQHKRAISILGYALQLNPHNYQARQLMQELEVAR